MRIINRREAIKVSVSRFLEAYKRYDQSMPMPWTLGKPLGHWISKVSALDPENCSIADLSDALPNGRDISKNECDCCGGDFENLVRFGDEPDYDARWQDLCFTCLGSAQFILVKAEGDQ